MYSYDMKKKNTLEKAQRKANTDVRLTSKNWLSKVCT